MAKVMFQLLQKFSHVPLHKSGVIVAVWFWVRVSLEVIFKLLDRARQSLKTCPSSYDLYF